MAISESHLATAKTILSAVGTATATAMVVRGVAQEFLPPEFQDYLFSGIRNFFSRFSNQLTLVIDEFDGLVNNEIYEAAETYLGPKVGPTTRRLKISKPEKEKNFNITVERDQEVVDVYNGEKFRWVWICRKTEARNFYNPRDMNSTLRSEVRSFELTFHKKNKDLVINSYLPYIADEAKNRKQEKKTIKIFTVDYENMYNMNDMWTPVTLDHPATFETLAMDSDQKDMILKDLDRFIQRREYYRKVGKAWKRGYLLYGPPGTGKSSLIAAMANYLNFDVYDLELTELRRNSELRRLLLATANKSILVVEDIDCTIDLQEKLANRATTSPPEFHQGEESKVTLSGLLNFVDGLWSSCGDERIIIFTTNHIEKLDPALLRPGRMDVHIHMSYCTPCGFKLLASNYLGVKEHSLFGEIEDLVPNAKTTPAEVAEQLLKNDDHDVSLQGLIDFLHKKIKENEEAEAGKARAESSAEKLENVHQGESEGNGEGKENSVSSAPEQEKLEGQ
ncbi:protein HYPER-SENSITIVITY-RELATED 4 [Sesamum alatum]|uniref:Protein HYPER-SENSITIVITY-RELATED 4 n=1 Tax=Sesamum alatum TaxID=300844 RepID=A0AAE2CCW1_9LAMI|nr:protein HYPER-SENSITIVITY-RELATED 4 [Sesamum alatum]